MQNAFWHTFDPEIKQDKMKKTHVVALVLIAVCHCSADKFYG